MTKPTKNTKLVATNIFEKLLENNPNSPTDLCECRPSPYAVDVVSS